MKLKVYKWLVCLVMVATDTYSKSVWMPTYAQQKGNDPLSTSEQYLEHLSATYGLGPDGMKKALQNTASHLIVMDCYAHTILRTPKIVLDKQQFCVQDQVDESIQNQSKAVTNATTWLDEVRPNIQEAIQKVITFGTQFDVYYDALNVESQKSNKKEIQQTIARLHEKLHGHTLHLVKLENDLQKFRSKLVEDTQRFQKNVNDLYAMKRGNEGEVSRFKKTLDKYHKQHRNGVIMIAGSVALTVVALGSCAAIVFVVPVTAPIITPLLYLTGSIVASSVGGGLMYRGLNNIEQSTKEMEKIEARSNEIERQLLGIQFVSLHEKTLLDTVQLAIESVQSLLNQFYKLEAKYINVEQSVEDLTETEYAHFKCELNDVKKNWQDIVQYAELLLQPLPIVQK